MADVFISYAREDRAKADQIARGLQALGLECFWDTEIPPGQTWADYIEGKLAVCKAVIVLWSAHSTGSQWVREEARMGRESGKLIPAMLDGSPAPFGFGEVQAANLSTWNGGTNHPDWLRFANAVHQAVKGANAPQPMKPAPQPVFATPAPSAASGAAAPPFDYIRRCFQLYFDGKGRARRSEFGWFAVFSFVAGITAMLIDISVFGINPYTGGANSVAVTFLVWLIFLAPSVSVASRRAHDMGQSGWLAILVAIPYVGFLAALLFAFVPGVPGDNQYGPDPKA
ncbi:MAG: DUF805 domain-containing protein [Hyphomonadaceae bacterium]|nr:DUF805 domain-containing protein [Hyphomonadaceae bacterium]